MNRNGRPNLDPLVKRLTDGLLPERSPDECWEWQKGKQGDGYGSFMAAGKVHRTHRLAWQLWKGPIPTGMLVLHKCDNPPCCNPHHLFLGTHKDNMSDMTAKKRGYLQNHPDKCLLAKPQAGALNRNARLTATDAAQIRSLISEGVKQRDIARQFGVSENHVKEIKYGRKWALGNEAKTSSVSAKLNEPVASAVEEEKKQGENR